MRQEIERVLSWYGKDVPETREEATDLVYFLCGVIESLRLELHRTDKQMKEYQEDQDYLHKKFILTRAYLPIHVRDEVDAGIDEFLQED